jgi:hypothetical protein
MAVVQSYTAISGSLDSAEVSNSQYLAQTFTTGTGYDIYAVKLSMAALILPGDIVVTIQETTASKPNGSVLATATIASTELTSWPNYPELPETWIAINFDAPATLSGSTMYAIVAQSTTETVALWNSDTAGTFADGAYNNSVNQGSSWSTLSARDLLFETHDAVIVTTAPTIRMIPFTYSASLAYECEFGNQYIRFYYDDAVLLNGASEVWIASPYTEEHLYELQYYQISDTMWITHPSYKTRKLTRTSATTFSLDVVEYNNGPFLTRNDLIDDTVNGVASMAYNGGALTCDGEVFQAGHVGALFKLIHPRPVTSISQSGPGTSDPISGKGTFTLITRGTWSGTMEIQRNDNNTSWYAFRTYKSSAGAEQNIKESFKEESDNVQYRLYADTGSAFRGELSTQDYLQESIVKITTVTDEQNAVATPIVAVPSTEPTKRWAEGAWSDVRTYPTSITFFNDRCVLAGEMAIPTQILIKPTDPE